MSRDEGGFSALRVEHETHYRYGAPVELAHHLAFLRPLQDEQQRLDRFELTIEPEPSHRSESRDAFGNSRVLFTVTSPHDELSVRAVSHVRVAPRLLQDFDPAASPAWEPVRDQLRYVAGRPFQPASEFCAPSPYVPRLQALAEYAAPSFTPGRPLASAAIELMERVHADFRYETQATEVDTPLAEVLERRAGVCQDFSHLMLGGLRALGFAARYISGYLLTEPVPGQPRLVGADASHAWLALWCPETPGLPGGWLELDPTNRCLAGTSHVRLAIGRDYGDVTPLRGVIRGGGAHTLHVRVSTSPDDP